MTDYSILLSPFADDALETNAVYTEPARGQDALSADEDCALSLRAEVESLQLWLDLNA